MEIRLEGFGNPGEYGYRRAFLRTLGVGDYFYVATEKETADWNSSARRIQMRFTRRAVIRGGVKRYQMMRRD